MHPRQRLLAVVGVEQQPVGQNLDARGEAVDPLGEVLVTADPEPQLGDLAGGVLADQRQR